MPGLFCSGMGAPLCRSRMDSHCTDRRGVQRGKAPLALGHPIGASSIPVGKGSLEGNSVPLGGRFPKEGSAFLGTRLSLGKSSVLYLCFRLTPGRGWLRHLLCGQIAVDRHFLATVGQADFVRIRTESGFAQRAKSAWPEKEAKVYQLPSRRSDSALVSLLLPWISHGSYRHCTGSCTVGCRRPHWTGCPKTPSGSACTGAGAGHCPPA